MMLSILNTKVERVNVPNNGKVEIEGSYHPSSLIKYLFVLNRRKITLVPLTPKTVYENQVRLQKEVDQN